jgi:hypothetical protein
MPDARQRDYTARYLEKRREMQRITAAGGKQAGGSRAGGAGLREEQEEVGPRGCKAGAAAGRAVCPSESPTKRARSAALGPRAFLQWQVVPAPDNSRGLPCGSATAQEWPVMLISPGQHVALCILHERALLAPRTAWPAGMRGPQRLVPCQHGAVLVLSVFPRQPAKADGRQSQKQSQAEAVPPEALAAPLLTNDAFWAGQAKRQLAGAPDGVMEFSEFRVVVGEVKPGGGDFAINTACVVGEGGLPEGPLFVSGRHADGEVARVLAAFAGMAAVQGVAPRYDPQWKEYAGPEGSSLPPDLRDSWQLLDSAWCEVMMGVATQ